MIRSLTRLLTPVLVLTLLVGLTSACLSSGKSSTPTTAPSAMSVSTPQANATAPAVGTTGAPELSTKVPGVSGTPGADITGPSVTVNDIAGTPTAYDGSVVTTHGEVEEVIGSNAFTIVDDNRELLVLAPDNLLPDTLTPGEYVQISGAVESFSVAAAEEQLGIALEDEQYARYADQPAMLLRGIRVGAMALSDMLTNASTEHGRTVNVIGEVTKVLGTQAATLSDAQGSGTVLVVTPFAAFSETMGQHAWVRVVGTVTTLADARSTHEDTRFDFLNDAQWDTWSDTPLVLGTLLEVVAPGATATVGDVLAQPEGAQVDGLVLSDRVIRRISANAFTIGQDGRELLVLDMDTDQVGIVPGALVVVSGAATTLDISNPPTLNGTPLGIDLKDANLAPFLGLRVVVALGVRVVEPGTP